MPLVWELPDGTIRVGTVDERYLAAHRRDGEDTAAAVLRLSEVLKAKVPALADAVGVRVLKTADLPGDGAQRHRWRLRNGKVVVDPTVPNRPHPKQALLDEIEAANSIGQLKAALRKALGG